jgi:two-component system response regulator FixJ
MPGIDGLKLLERLNQDRVPLQVIMISGHSDIEIAVKAMKLGAVDFLEKPFTEEALLSAIAAAKERALPQPVDDDIAAATVQLATLSRREFQVLSALAAGQQQKTIAYDLGISVRTVEVHRARMMRRLGTRSLAEAVRVIVLAGLDSTVRGTSSARWPMERS